MVADVDGAVRALGLERPVVIGHSMGGMNAMTFAARNPSLVRALVLVDVGPEVSVDGAREVGAFVAGPYELESLDAWVEHTHRYYPWRSKERIRARLAVSLRQTPDGRLAKQYDERFRQGFGGVAEARDALADVAAALRCPTLLVHGARARCSRARWRSASPPAYRASSFSASRRRPFRSRATSRRVREPVVDAFLASALAQTLELSAR
jgi:pimeloyl-ACP methyl ester carboxylesterase